MASSSSSFPSIPTFSSQLWKYHVFLSFRGEDTRKNFVDHLYTALVQQGIYTYKDDATLPQGESISPSLMKAIEESKIAVIVFSKNYADSSWCLDELAYIMRCKDNRGQIVIPIFYHVDTSEVRKQKWKYGEAFAKHESENNSKVECWRKALVDASNVSGWESKHVANGHESECIKQIVDTISHRLCPVTPSVNDNLVGVEARMQHLMSKLQIELGGKSMIGIWGVGGGGKTTLASAIYYEISSNFDGCCFLKNIREEANKNGLEKLQEKILCGVLKQKQVEVGRVEEGRDMIKDRLHHRKVLIVLDDVDKLEHLKELVGSRDWFGEGSRIIITTRDEHVLTAHKVDVIHNINLLNDDEATKLFCKHAPRDNRPMEDYMLLSRDVVSYAAGLPLAVRVLGCFLCDKDINEWRSALARLKEIPEADIVEKLKISYDGLKLVEKKLFLDIACFLRGRDKSEGIMAMLDACGFYPVIGIKVLIQKALITISDGRFDMHDLVQEMGYYIVRGEHPNNPEKHSRVWKKEDVLKLSAIDTTKELDMNEAIRFDPYSYASEQMFPPILANMKNLRCIDWKGDIARPFPTNFPPVELCCLILNGILQKQLWEGYKHLPNLKIMELTRLNKLIMTPDFDGLPNLERFILHGCRCLEEIHPSIGRLEKLDFLSIENCSGLKMFPPITRLKKIETLSLSICIRIYNLSEIQRNMDILQRLHLYNGGKEVVSSKRASTNFFVACWTCGDTEVKKPREYHTDVQDTCLSHNNMNNNTGIRFPKGLRKLDLWYCNVGDKYIGSAVWELPNLQELDLRGNKFSRLNFSLLRLPQLKCLNVSGCKKLVELLELPSSLAILRADGCTSLESFGDISNCKWLWKVSLREDNKVDPLGQEILLHSMLQGNAIEDHFMSVSLEHQMIPNGLESRLFRGKTFRLHLPDEWYNDFCGFLICIVTPIRYPNINIIIKHEVDEDSQFEVWQESNEVVEVKYDGTTFVGYVSFSLLRHTALLSSSYNTISFSITDMGWSPSAAESNFGAKLVPRKSKCDLVQTTTDRSEFWNKEREHGTTFTIQHDSESSIKILWQPFYYKQKIVVKIDVPNHKEKFKAMRAVARISGIVSLSVDMNNKILTVIGDVDPVDIVRKLEICCHAEILTVGPTKNWW